VVEDFEKMNSLSLKEEIFNKASPAKTSKIIKFLIYFFLLYFLAYSYSSGKVNGYNNSNNSLSSQKK
jgi:hypothetical protein